MLTPEQIAEMESVASGNPKPLDLEAMDRIARGGKEASVGIGETARDNLLQGATFGLGNRAQAGLAALMASGINNRPLAENYKTAREVGSQRLTQGMRDNPITAIASNIAGGLSTGGLAATTKIGATIGNSLRTGNLAARVAKGAATGAASGAAFGAGTAEYDQASDGAVRGAVLGAVGGAVLPAAGAGIKRLNTKTIVPTSEQVREAGSKWFQIAEQKGGALNEATANKFYNQIMRIRPQTVEGRVFKGKSPVADVIDSVPELMGRPMTLRAAKEIDEALGDMAYSTMDNFGKLSSDGKRFLDMQVTLRRLIENADENMIIGGREGFDALKEGRKYWSASLRMRDIERIIENAQRMDQPATSIRAGFRTLLRNGNKMKGYSDAEVKAIKKAAETGVITDVLRLAGSGLVPIGGGIAGTAAGGPLGGVTAAAGSVAVQQGSKALATARQMSRANEALKAAALPTGMVTTQQRIAMPTMQQIMNMPPAEARLALEKLRQVKDARKP